MRKDMDEKRDWRIFRGGQQTPHERIYKGDLPDPPIWRSFSGGSLDDIPDDESYRSKLMDLAAENWRDQKRGQSFYLQTSQEKQEQVIDAVNAALYLRRPLLVTGQPGSGKTSLAYAVAYQLMLGPVLMWPITVRSTLQEGLYQYDAIARLQDAQLSIKQSDQLVASPNIGDYLRLGPLGTAFLRARYPRVLLIDEIDKADINLPNDLLNLFEEGGYKIPELVRLAKKTPKVNVLTTDGIETTIPNGTIQCGEFPLVILTSNGERDFPPAFLRRCLRVRMPAPSVEDLTKIVQSHINTQGLSPEIDLLIQKLIKEFVKRRDERDESLATDQLLNTVYLLTHNVDNEKLKDLLLKSLTSIEEYA